MEGGEGDGEEEGDESSDVSAFLPSIPLKETVRETCLFYVRSNRVE